MPVNMKNIIADTFMKMVRKKGIDKITVKVLIDECGISRQTFYYHFRDIMDVVEWLVKKFVDHMVERSLEIGTPENAVKVLAYGLCGVLFKCCESGHFDVEKIAEQICYILPGRIETL